ncbi:DUF4296 domain-containing protein [Psychroflexus montanilacus]|uniref:DUF4296 domain-containing protein n=1 Tax=Psychroflexus montanilacus TaxID=2873598 RepID=UPI001CCEB77E|nr:DUF4296 domain-containing protein [Psychroflexus montanilacus]MBZ9651532.1 DUF4296 domain-containing protein [Psychroflexus montanilacus]
MGLVFITSCQNVEKIEKPEKLLSKSEMKDLLYDMVLLDAASGVNEKRLKDLDIKMFDFLSKKYKLDSIELKQNIQYYNMKFDDNLEIYEQVKDSISRLEQSYDSITKARDSLKKLERKRRDSIRKLDTVQEKQIIRRIDEKD